MKYALILASAVILISSSSYATIGSKPRICGYTTREVKEPEYCQTATIGSKPHICGYKTVVQKIPEYCQTDSLPPTNLPPIKRAN